MSGLGRFLTTFLAVSVLAGCSSKGPRVIPEDDLVRIYADMFLADEWMKNHSELRTQTDTMLVYEPIFQRYGYTTEDYWESIDHYLEDPKSYGALLGKSADLLKSRNEKFISIRQAKKDSVEMVHRQQDIADSLARVKDSLLRIPCRIPLYRDRVFFCDTLPYRDTVFALDTLRWRLLDFSLDSLNAVRAAAIDSCDNSLSVGNDSIPLVIDTLPLRKAIEIKGKPVNLVKGEPIRE